MFEPNSIDRQTAASHDRLARSERAFNLHLDFGSLVKGGRVTPHWLEDGASFWFTTGCPEQRLMFVFDATVSSLRPLFDISRLRAALKEGFSSDPPGQGVPFDEVKFQSPDALEFEIAGIKYQLNLTNYALSKRSARADHVDDPTERGTERGAAATYMQWKFYGAGRYEPVPAALSPDGRWNARIENSNLVVQSTSPVAGEQIIRLTSDGTATAFWDVEAVLGVPWSPTGENLAVFKHHIEGMPRLSVINWLDPLKLEQTFIPMPAGGVLPRTELFLVDLHTQTPRAIDLGTTLDEYLRVEAWSADGKELIISRYDRAFSQVKIQAIDVNTLAVRTILVETSNTFVSNHHNALWSLNSGFTLLPDRSGFLWCSERTGWRHIDLHDMDGRFLRQLTSGAWPVADVLRVDHSSAVLYFTAHSDLDRPYDTHFCRVSLDGSGFAQLTEGKGQHSVSVSPDGRVFTDTYSNVDQPPRTVLRSIQGDIIHVLEEGDISRLDEEGWVPPREFVVKAADGITDLWATVFYPFDFDPSRIYPVVEHIYGGPQSIWRPLEFGDEAKGSPLYLSMNFNRALAHLGFIVVILDARGTPGRSKAFHDTIYRNWGQFEIDDHAGALRQLAAANSCFDLSRVGVWGLSWGGHFAFRALAQAGDLYKAAICEVPQYDPRHLALYEPYLGLPEDSAAHYDTADPYTLANSLSGELLLIAGMMDPFTPTDLFRMSDILIRCGKHHEVMCYPDSGHVTEGQTALYDVHLKKRFLTKHLVEHRPCPT